MITLKVFSKDQARLLQENLRLSRQLREAGRKAKGVASRQCDDDPRPQIFYEKGPNGSYPVIAFKTGPCDKYLQGHCVPCGYSAEAAMVSAGKTAEENILAQVEWLLQNAPAVFGKQRNGSPISMELAGQSSFFRDQEIPVSARKKIFQILSGYQRDRAVQFQVMLETRAEHLVAAANSGELETLRPYLAEFNVVVNIGLEYEDHFLRNVLFAKDLDLSDFLKAIEIAHSFNLDPGVFVFAGGYILTINEALDQLRKSLQFLAKIGAFANVMIPNIQEFSIPDLLFEFDGYSLPEPFFLLDVVDMLLEFSPHRPHSTSSNNWFVGGLVAEPVPRATILSNPRRRTSQQTTDAVYDCFQNLVITNDIERYQKEANLLRRKPDYRFHIQDRQKQDERPLETRLYDLLLWADSRTKEYTCKKSAAVVKC